MAESTSDSEYCEGCNLKSMEIGYMCYMNRQHSKELHEFLIKHNVIPAVHKCGKCGKNCATNYKRGIFTCNKVSLELAKKSKNKRKSCNYRKTIYKGTFFSNINLPIWKVFNLVFLYLSVPDKRVSYIKNDMNVSPKTFSDWSSFIREVCIDWAVRNSTQIGGKNVVVEIDEVEFSRHKNNMGKVVSGQWVFGGVESENKWKQFFIPVENRDQDILVDLIKTHIKPGSIIHSDCWMYENISEEGFNYLKVNHNLNFVDPVTGARTQNIKRLCRDLRSSLPQYGRRRQHLTEYLAEARFRQTYNIPGERFHEFWKAVGVLYPYIDEKPPKAPPRPRRYKKLPIFVECKDFDGYIVSKGNNKDIKEENEDMEVEICIKKEIEVTEECDVLIKQEQEEIIESCVVHIKEEIDVPEST